VRHGHNFRRRFHPGREADVYHHVVWRHRVEIEVWPAHAEINFQDEWTANPIDTQVRFESQVYNSTQGCLWEVRDINGNPGQGTIDASGLYRAPPKGALASGTTEIVVASAREDPLRKAFAWVTLIGVGPRPVTPPEVTVWPKRVNLYYAQGANNDYIDDCNKRCEFSSTAYDTSAQTEWLVDAVLQGVVGPTFVYGAPNSGGAAMVTVRAQLQGQPAVFDEATVFQRNYNWPGA
jgi:hypothetical protein